MGQKMLLPVRTALMIGGIVLIGISVALFRLAGFGVDPFTGMNVGTSPFLGWSFGNWQLLANTLILAVVFFTVRSCIGLGTLVNMVCVGYIADFICWLVQEALTLTLGIPVRILLLPAALLFASSGVALYMKADMGIAPYDSVAVVIETLTRERIPFHIARILSDVTVVVIGAGSCLMAGETVWLVIGVGTVCNAFLNGPAIQQFRKWLDCIFENDS